MMRDSSISKSSRVSADFRFSQLRGSSMSKISRVSQISNGSSVNLTPSKVTSTAIQSSFNINNAPISNPKHLLPPKHPSKASPYFSSNEQIFCVICKKSYKTNQLSTHLLLHKLPTLVPAQTMKPTARVTPSKSQNSLVGLKSKSIDKFKQLNTLNTPKINTFSIAPSIPKNQKTSPPLPTPIFQPTTLGLQKQSDQISYQQQYLNPEKHSLKKSKSKVNNLNCLFNELGVKSCQSQYRKVQSPFAIYYSEKLKYKNSDRSKDEQDRVTDILSFQSIKSYY